MTEQEWQKFLNPKALARRVPEMIAGIAKHAARQVVRASPEFQTGEKTRAAMDKGRRSPDNPRCTKLDSLLPQVQCFLATLRGRCPELGNNGMIGAAVKKFKVSESTVRRWIKHRGLRIPPKR